MSLQPRTARLSALLALCALGAAGARAEPAKDATIAIAAIENRGGATADQAALLGDVITATLVNEGRLRVVERAQMTRVMKEQALAQSGAMSDEVQIKLAQLVNARWIMVGSVAGEGRGAVLSVRVIDSSTGQVVHADTQKLGAAEQLDAGARNLARRLQDKLVGPDKSGKTRSTAEAVGDFDVTAVKEASRQLARMLAVRFPRVEGKIVDSLPDGSATCHIADLRSAFKGQRFEVAGHDEVTESEVQKGLFLLSSITESGCSGRIKRTGHGEINGGDTLRSIPLKVGMDPLDVGAGTDPALGKLLSEETRNSLKNQGAFDLSGEALVTLVGRINGERGHRIIEVQAMDKSGTILQRWDLNGTF